MWIIDEIFRYKKLFTGIVFLLLAINFVYYLHMYYIHWGRNYSNDWQYGYKQAVEVAKKHYNDVDKIIVTSSLGRPYSYFLFYTPVDPKLFHSNSNVVVDRFYFIDVYGFDKYIFSKSPTAEKATGKLLLITTPSGLPEDAQKLETINNLSGQPVFDIGTITR